VRDPPAKLGTKYRVKLLAEDGVMPPGKHYAANGQVVTIPKRAIFASHPINSGTMNTITQLQQDITRYEADAAYYEEYAKRCRSEADLLREELENERDGKRPGVEEAHRLAVAILRLDGLTGAEIEAAEITLSDEPADIQRLRQIAANHSLALDFL
jgi:hypothetical protein